MNQVTKGLVDRLKRFTKSPMFPTVGALIFICVFLTIFRPSTFFTLRNFWNVLRQASVNVLIVCGMTFVLITGGIDLSVGSVAGITALITAFGIKAGLPLVVALLVGLTLGVLIGTISGLLVTYVKVPPFIATLAMQTSLRGAIMVLSQGQPVTLLGPSFRYIAAGFIGPIPFPVVLMLVVVGIVAYVLKFTRFGRHLYAVGGNVEAARLSGVRANWTIIRSYILCGLLAATAGMVMAARVDSATPNAGLGYELDAIASAVIGGISLSGGKGMIIGGLLGALIIAVLNNGMTLMNVSVYYTDVVKGLVILFAVVFDSLGVFKKRGSLKVISAKMRMKKTGGQT